CTLLLLATSVVLLSRCSPKIASTTASSETSAEVAAIKQKYSEAQIEEGRLIYQSSCGKCHKLFEPESKSIEKWETVLPKMQRLAKLDETDGGKVRAYLLTHAKQ